MEPRILLGGRQKCICIIVGVSRLIAFLRTCRREAGSGRPDGEREVAGTLVQWNRADTRPEDKSVQGESHFLSRGANALRCRPIYLLLRRRWAWAWLPWLQVKESISGECFLIEKGQLKPIDRDLPTHQQLEPGAEVAYYDNDINNWISGTILVS